MNTTESRRKWRQDEPILLRWRNSGEVVEGVTLTLGTLDILFLKQGFNGLFDVLNLGSEPLRDLRDDLLDQILVLERLARLHDPDNGRLDDVLAIFVDRLEYINCLRLDFCLDRLVEVDTNLAIHDQV
jgi:hypothetical protein